jgi:Sigma-70, region 4
MPRPSVIYYNASNAEGSRPSGTTRRFGARSVQEIRDFCESVATENRASLADVLPYDAHRARLSFLEALRLLLNSLGEQTRTIVTKRLVRGATLQAVGETLDLSRQRIQQLESGFLDDLGRYLEWFEADRDELFFRVKFHGSITEAFAELQSTEDAAICAAAVERLFRSSKERQQLEQDYEALFESWIIELGKRSAFHFGQMRLASFVSEMGNRSVAKDFAAYGRRNRAFNFDAETDIIAPLSTPNAIGVVTRRGCIFTRTCRRQRNGNQRVLGSH